MHVSATAVEKCRVESEAASFTPPRRDIQRAWLTRLRRTSVVTRVSMGAEPKERDDDAVRFAFR